MPDYEYDIFLSYNRAQKDWTRELARRIRDAGFKVWFDEWMLKAGDNWIDKLAEGAAKSNKIAPIMSPEYLNSEWGNFEANIGIQEDPSGKNDRLLLIMFSDCKLPPKFAQRQGVNFCATHGDQLSYEFRLAQLLHALDPSREYIEDFEVFSKMQDKELADALPKVGALPSGSVMPYSPNPNFVGREDELKSLYKMLQAGSSAALAQTAVATGLGGIGKTQLAVEFAYRYGRRYDGGVYWVSMADPESVPDQLYRFAAPDAMNIGGYGSAPRDDLIALVKKEWSGLRKRLVIFSCCQVILYQYGIMGE